MREEPRRQFLVLAEVSEGIALPSADTKYTVKIRIADKELKTGKPKKRSGGYCSWNQRFDEQVWEAPYRSLEEVGSVFVYLMDGDTPVCFHRAPASDFEGPEPPLRWVPLTNDQSIGKVDDEYQAGLLSFKITIHDLA